MTVQGAAMTASKTIWVGSPVLSSCFSLSLQKFWSLLFPLKERKRFYSLPDCLASLHCLVEFLCAFHSLPFLSNRPEILSHLCKHTHTQENNKCAINSLNIAETQPNSTLPLCRLATKILFLFSLSVNCLPPKSTWRVFGVQTKPTPPRVEPWRRKWSVTLCFTSNIFGYIKQNKKIPSSQLCGATLLLCTIH